MLGKGEQQETDLVGPASPTAPPFALHQPQSVDDLRLRKQLNIVRSLGHSVRTTTYDNTNVKHTQTQIEKELDRNWKAMMCAAVCDLDDASLCMRVGTGSRDER